MAKLIIDNLKSTRISAQVRDISPASTIRKSHDFLEQFGTICASVRRCEEIKGHKPIGNGAKGIILLCEDPGFLYHKTAHTMTDRNYPSVGVAKVR